MLHKVSVPVLSDADCRLKYSSQDVPAVADSMICVQNSSDIYKGTCAGDSGGPFTVDDNNSTTAQLIGLVSWGEGGCADTGYPSVFTQVSYFVDWIRDKLDNNQ